MNKAILSLLIALCLISATQQKFEVYKEFFGARSLQPTDLDGWTTENFFNNNRITNCGDVSIVGGYSSAGNGAKLSYDLEDLPEHYRVRVQATVYFVDSWDNEWFQAYSGNSLLFQEQSHLSKHTAICGSSSWGERISRIEFSFGHLSKSLNLNFRSTLNQASNDESWGIREIVISLEKCDDNCEVVNTEFVNSEFVTVEGFKNSGWELKNEVSDENLIKECDGRKYIGGHNAFAQQALRKTFTDLPQHTRLFVIFDLWFIDSWDSNDKFRAYADGFQFYENWKTVGHAGGELQCTSSSQSWKDHRITAFTEFPHSGDSVELRLEDFVNQAANDESWGFSNFRLYALNYDYEVTQITKEFYEESFNSDAAAGWVDANGDEFDTVTHCNGVSMLGGFDVLGGSSVSGKYVESVIRKTFDNLPEHNTLILQLELWFIDNNTDHISVTANGLPVFKFKRDQGNFFKQVDGCGAQAGSRAQVAQAEFPHYGDSVVIEIFSDRTSATVNASWGVRDFELYTRDASLGKLVNSQFTAFENTENSGWVVEKDAKYKEDLGACRGNGINGLQGSKNGSQSYVIEDLPPHNLVTIEFAIYGGVGVFNTVIDDQTYSYVDQLVLGPSTNQNGMAAVDCNLSTSNYAQIFYKRITYKQTGPTLHFTLNNANNDFFLRDFRVYVSNENNFAPVCPTIFAECGFRGRKFEFCDDVPDFQDHDWDFVIKSVFIPNGWGLTLFNDVNYDGESHEVTESIECLEDGPEYSLLQLSSLRMTNQVSAPQQIVESKAVAVEESHKAASQGKQHLRHNKKSHHKHI